MRLRVVVRAVMLRQYSVDFVIKRNRYNSKHALERKALQAEAANFMNLIAKSSVCYLIPMFQRRYSWTEKEAKQLWADIIKVGNKTVSPFEHFTGTITYIQPKSNISSDSHEVMVIDGQQRLTTLFLILRAIAEVLENDSSTRANYHIESIDIKNKYLFLNAGAENGMRLILTDGDRSEFESIIITGKPLKGGGSLSAVYNYFLKEVKSQLSNPISGRVLELGLDRLKIVDLSLSPTDNYQEIFESMNSTGKSLKESDLVRNYILMQESGRAQEKLYKDLWLPLEKKFGEKFDKDFNNFIWYYLTVKMLAIPKIKEVYPTFRRYYEEKYGNDIRGLLEDLNCYADYYVEIAYSNPNDHTVNSEEFEFVTAFYDIVHKMKITLVLPLILKLYADYRAGEYKITKQEAVKSIRYVESYYLRRHVLGLQASNMNVGFEELMQKIDTSNYYQSFINLLAGQSSNSRVFPSDEAFKEALLTQDIYNKKLNKYILDKLETSGKKNTSLTNYVNDEKVSIEHVLPQGENLNLDWKEMLGSALGINEVVEDNNSLYLEEQKKYMHRLGNLTLTYYNSEYSNKRLYDKIHLGKLIDASPPSISNGNASIESKVGLAYSEFSRLNQEFIDQAGLSEPIWNQNSIENRGTRLADLAISIWIFPTEVKAQAKIELSSKKRVYTTKIEDLVNVGLFSYPQTIEAMSPKYSGYTATLAEGESVDYNGKRYTSVSASGKAVKEDVNGEANQPNGWDFWGIKQPDGTLMSLSEYRAIFESDS